jgi:hypothetical protein
VAVISVPLLIALGVLHSPRWFPLLDLAQTELRVRDVMSRHMPLIGLPGRFGTFPNQGSHPGPLSFYTLWPFYRVFGASAFALQVATASIHIVALALALWVARRRGGTPMMLVVGALVALLYSSYGAEILTEAWNPYMPVSWWFLFLLAMWSVASGDFVVLPVGVFAATFCMQTHVPYLGLAGAVLVFTVVAAIVVTYRSHASDETRRDMWRWIAIGAALGVVLWLPPLIEQFRHDPGNLTVLSTDLRHPRETVTGVKEGLSLLFTHLNPWHLFSNGTLTPDQRTVTGALAPGVAYCVAWALSAIVALRTRVRSLIALHLVVALAVLFAAISMVRIAGVVYFYLVLWSWGVTVLMGFAIAATACVVVGARLDATARERAVRFGSVGLAALIVLQTVFFAIDASDTQVPNAPVTATVGAVSRPTIAALESGKVPGGGRDGRYLVTWYDLMTLGARGYSLLLELERHGFHVGGDDFNRVGITLHRVMDPSDATAEVHLVSGRGIAEWAARPGVVRVAYYDPRDARERAEYTRVRGSIVDELRRRGQPRLASAVQADNLAAALSSTFPGDLLPGMRRLLALGLPLAVFVGPPSR